MASPSCFISYSWESQDHKTWVRQLASDLQNNGVHVLLDQWDLSPGTDLTKYMETSIRESHFVLLICTPSFAEKANEVKGGVGYEKSIVTGEIFSNAEDETKFVPILKKGSVIESLPSYLKSRLFIDFRENELYESSLLQILRHFYASPEHERPPLGEKPNLESFQDKIINRENKENLLKNHSNEREFDLSNFRELVQYASESTNYGGLGYSADDAVAWAQNNLNLDLVKFRELVQYASESTNYGGLGYSVDDAVSWALQKV